MILCVSREIVAGKDNKYSKVVLQADTAEEIAEMPLTGAGVNDIPDSVMFYPSSILVCLANSKRYILGGDNTWHEYTA